MLKSAIESILFTSGEPVRLDKLAQVLCVKEKLIEETIDELIEKFSQQDSGISLLRLKDKIEIDENSYLASKDSSAFEKFYSKEKSNCIKYQLCSKSENAQYVKEIMDIRRNTPLSPAAMEVLAIVAYNQPVTKAFVEQIRGIDSSSILNNLCNKNLLEEKGRLELPGRPLLYGTTSNFLRCFGISSLYELPDVNKKPEELQFENIKFPGV